MNKLRLGFLVFLMAMLVGCDSMPSFDDVLPDERQEYRRSRDLPPLEVPPDLTNNTNDAMAIPGASPKRLAERPRALRV